MSNQLMESAQHDQYVIDTEIFKRKSVDNVNSDTDIT